MLGVRGEDKRDLRDIAPGEFVAFGPALSEQGVTRFRAGAVVTTHPKSGQRHAYAPPKASEAIKKIAAQLEDLPQAAEEEARDLAGLRAQLAEANQKIRRLESAKPAPAETKTERVEVPVLKDAELKRLETVFERAESILDKLGDMSEDINVAAKEVRDALTRSQAQPGTYAALKRSERAESVFPVVSRRQAQAYAELCTSPPPDNPDITRPMQRILDALQSFRVLGLDSVSKSNVAVFSDQSPTSSGFANNLGRLRTLGMIDYPAGGMVALTSDGLAQAGNSTPIASLDELHRAWFSKLPNPKVRILENLIRIYPKSLSKGALAELSGQSSTSSGYANNLGALRSLGLIDYPRTGEVAATALLFPEGLV
jgi:hypothetical protein